MEAHILAAPPGFPDAVLALNERAAQAPAAFAADVAAAAKSASADGDGALDFILTGARRTNTVGPTLSAALTRCTAASPAVAAAVAAASAASAAPPAGREPSRGAPSLVGVEWALGLPTDASSMAPGGAGAPFVALSLTVHDSPAEGAEAAAAAGGASALRTIPLALTVPQLGLLEATLREALLALERV